MKSAAFHFLRVGLAITFLWIGILIFKNPEAWSGYLQPWAAGLLPIPMAQVMIGTAILDIIIGVFLLIDFLPWLAAFVGAVHLVIVLTVSGITDITVRDIGLLAAMLALMIDSLPSPFATEQVVTFTDTGYSPNTLIIKNGETVVFKNQSSRTMWPASAMHPTHREYPTTGGCLGSTFDACKGVQPSDSWSFKFDFIGAWKYHDHLNPGNTGTIIVQ
ncbi:MAG: DoxX family membrane protein [Patescibacteria group bacterium]